MGDRDPGALLEVLEEGRRRGFLGPGPAARQLEHAVDLARAIGECTGRMLDLGSGGGLPGLVLFGRWPRARGVLLDAQRRRCEFLSEAVSALRFSSRVEVRCGRAEILARDPSLRGGFDLVVARSFGPPAVTAECAAAFLSPQAALVVSEPPDSGSTAIEQRWAPAGLRQLGLGPATGIRAGTAGAARTVLVSAVEERWPRRNGIPAKRPLW